MTYTCTSCGDIYTESIPSVEHTIVNHPAFAPTCTENGVSAYQICGICYDFLSMPVPIPPLGHTWEHGLCITCCTPHDFEIESTPNTLRIFTGAKTNCSYLMVAMYDPLEKMSNLQIFSGDDIYEITLTRESIQGSTVKLFFLDENFAPTQKSETLSPAIPVL